MANTPTWLASVCQILLIIAMPVILVVSPLYVFVTPAFVRHEYSRKEFGHADRFDDQERLRISDTILHYLRDRTTLQEMAAMRTVAGEIALKDDEVQHLVDVKMVMQACFLAHKIALIMGVICSLVLWRSAQRALLPTSLRRGVWLTAGLMGLIALSSIIDFDLFFTRFHQVFFEANTWMFHERDTLIQLYPLHFWSDTVWKIALVILMEAGLSYLLSYVLQALTSPGKA